MKTSSQDALSKLAPPSVQLSQHDGAPPLPIEELRRAAIPLATYRLQFNRDFTFTQASEVVPYLAELGISHCYSSPYLKARPGSSHGYDIVDHSSLNPEIGTTESYEEFLAKLKKYGLGQILDFVPNHMGVMGADNAWWMDVLENGPSSEWSKYFDIDWEPLNAELSGKILLPLLGEHYGKALESCELRLDFDSAIGAFNIYYHQHQLPVDPASYTSIIELNLEQLANALGPSDLNFTELQSLLTAFRRLPVRTETSQFLIAERQRDKDVHKRHLATLCKSCPSIAQHIRDNLLKFNGSLGNPASFDLLHALIQQQGYRLAYWRVASDEINYRRFFDINELAAMRMEECEVFEKTHRFVIDLLVNNKLDGLRIDHPDGLHDPALYFSRLQQAVGGRKSITGEALPTYLAIEKILAEHEHLPEDWLIHGTTGYRFSNQTNALFVDASAEQKMTRIYQSFTGEKTTFDLLAYTAKRLIMRTALAGELNVLATRLARIAAARRDTCDFTLQGLRNALVEVVACFPVYRTYVTGNPISPDDRGNINWAVAVAKKRSPTADNGIYDFIQNVLTIDIARGCCESYRLMIISFAMKFQQFSSPVMAKGLEDTAFYRYHRLISLNDVGGDPRRFGLSVAAYHASTRARSTRWPNDMLASSTHDSKRSEDVRSRLNVLSEIPAAWKLMLKRWSRLNRRCKLSVDQMNAPSRNDEYLLYQTLVGAWPLSSPDAAGMAKFCERVNAYMIKAIREAKEHSSWANVNSAYESAVNRFVQSLLTPSDKNLFLSDFIPMVQPISHFGLLNSLAQTLIKTTAPGVPDIYQGCELWQFNLVDPDNRRPVDFTQRRQLLAQVRSVVESPRSQWRQKLQELLDDMTDGRIKMYLIERSLALRQLWPEVFRSGQYQPLNVVGTQAAHVLAFARFTDTHCVITIVPRLTARLLGNNVRLPVGLDVWGDTALELLPEWSNLTWSNTLSGESHATPGQFLIGNVFSYFPLALLSAELN